MKEQKCLLVDDGIVQVSEADREEVEVEFPADKSRNRETGPTRSIG